jgi:H+/Cl- antiporter ClcA
MIKNNIHAFILSSSLPVFAITMGYLSYNYAKNDQPKEIAIELYSLGVPLLFGIMGVINYNLIKFGSANSLLLGALFGVALSLVGRYYFDIPEKLFKMHKDKQKVVHMYSPVLYSFIFYFILSPMQDLLIPQ